MTTETKILTDEQVGDLYQDWYCFFKDSPGSAGLCIRAIEQAVLQSPEIQALRSALKEAIITLERDGDEWGVCDRLRAAMETQPC